MKKRHYVFGALAALSLFTLASCGDEGGKEPEPTPEVVDYKVSEQEFNNSISKMSNDDYVWIEKTYNNSISAENLSTTNTYNRKGNWMTFESKTSASSMNYYYYIGSDKVAGYYSFDGTIHSISLNLTALDSFIGDNFGIYSSLTFNEEEKTYVGTNIFIEVSSNTSFYMDIKCKFENKKLIHMEEKATMSVSGTQSIVYSVGDCTYGNASVTVPQNILDYHNTNYNK